MSRPVESFLASVRRVRDAGGVAETSFYPAIAAARADVWPWTPDDRGS